MPSVGQSLKQYFYIYLVGLVIEYLLIKHGIVPESIQAVVVSSWGRTLFILSAYRIFTWIMDGQ